MADETRAAGWYEDPWGTNDERYYDGSAWTRQTRIIGASDAATIWPPIPAGLDAPAASPAPPASAAAPQPPAPAPESASPWTGAPDPAPPAISDAARVDGPPDRVDGPADRVAGPPDAAPALAPAPPAVPAGWHPDPWALSALRWWDGSGWTGHVSGPAATKPIDIVGERALARWVHPLLLVGGLAQAFGMFVNASQAKWFVEHWDQLTTPGANTPSPPSGGALTGLIFPLTIAVSVLFLLWFYRAASTAWASGLPARRGPLLSTLSFIIPVLNLWWPYQAAMAMVPADDSRRGVIQRWWMLWLVGTLCGYLIYPAQAIFNATAAIIVAAVGAVAMLGAALAARVVVQYITSTHEQLGQAATAG